VTLTGSGKIDPPAIIGKGLMALQQHTFAHEWSWELTIVGKLQIILDDVSAGNGFSVSDSSFQVGKEWPHASRG